MWLPESTQCVMEPLSKRHFSQWFRMMKTHLFQKWLFSMVRQEIGKWKADKRKQEEVPLSKIRKICFPVMVALFLFLYFFKHNSTERLTLPPLWVGWVWLWFAGFGKPVTGWSSFFPLAFQCFWGRCQKRPLFKFKHFSMLATELAPLLRTAKP